MVVDIVWVCLMCVVRRLSLPLFICFVCVGAVRCLVFVVCCSLLFVVCGSMFAVCCLCDCVVVCCLLCAV